MVTVPTAYAGARGGVEGRTQFAIDTPAFARGVDFLIERNPTVLVIGYLAHPDQVEIVAAALNRYSGLVVLDPVLGSYERGLNVPAETARRIRDLLLPRAQIVTPNRFEAEVLLDLTRAKETRERAVLDGLAARGPGIVVVTSFARDAERRRATTIFSNGYVYERIASPYHSSLPGYGAGDILAGGIAVMLALGATPWAATVLATALASLAVERTTGYGAATADPVAALDLFKPLSYLSDGAAARYAERFGVTAAAIAAKDGEGARLRFGPPKDFIVQ
jgi:pyridoxal/pyridoxine/pyridoxamine kinase